MLQMHKNEFVRKHREKDAIKPKAHTVQNRFVNAATYKYQLCQARKYTYADLLLHKMF